MTLADWRVLICDCCGRELVVKQTDAESARIDASSQGWKFLTYTNFIIKGRSKSRSWDCCPECPLPARELVLAQVTAEQAAKEKQ